MSSGARKNAFSIEVSCRHDKDLRDVAVKQNGRVCFTTTHRRVLWAFLADFLPSTSLRHHDSGATASDANAFGVQHAPVDSLEGYYPHAHVTPADVAAQSEYLCVFHREELKDMHGRYTVCVPATLCSAYAVPSGTSSQFVLHHIQPTAICPGVMGVFVHGQSQSSRRHAAPTMMVGGALYHAAVDMWWMASPLVIKPVYISCGEQEKSQHAAAAEAEPVASTFVASAPASPMFSPQSFLPSQGSRGGFPAAPLPETPSSVVPALTSSSSYSTTSAAPAVGGTVLLQFSHTMDMDDGQEQIRFFVVARCGPQEIGLAVVRPQLELDIVTWHWCRHRLTLPKLCASNNALRLVVSEHKTLERQFIFLQDTRNDILHVVRTPNLNTGDGEMELCFTLPTQGHPTVVPSLRLASPQPILVCNYPEKNDVSLYSPLQLLLHGATADNCLTTLKKVMQFTGGTGRAPSEREYGLSHNDVSQSAQPEEISGIASQNGAALVFFYNASTRSSNLLCEGEDSAAIAANTGEDSQVAEPRLSQVLSQQANPNAHRRCEKTFKTVVELPSVQSDHNAFLQYALEALEATLGKRHVYELECVLMRRAYAAKSRTLVKDTSAMVQETVRSSNQSTHWSYTREFAAILSEVVQQCTQRYQNSVEEENARPPAIRVNVRAASTTSSAAAATATDERLKWFQYLSDPLLVNASTIEIMYQSIEQRKATSTKPPTSLTNGEEEVSEKVPQWSMGMCKTCVLTLHILFESFRLQERFWTFLQSIADVIYDLASQLQWKPFVVCYAGFSDNTLHYNTVSGGGSVSSESGLESLSGAFHYDEQLLRTLTKGDGTQPDVNALLAPAVVPPLIFATLNNVLYGRHDTLSLWPMIRGLGRHHPITVANRLYSLYVSCFCRNTTSDQEKLFIREAASGGVGGGPQEEEEAWWQRVCRTLVKDGVSDTSVLSNLGIGVSFPLLQALVRGKDNPGVHWDNELLSIVGRLDCVTNTALLQKLAQPGEDVLRTAEACAIGRQYRATITDDDGVIMRSDFPKTWRDSRLDSVQALFNTATPLFLPGQGDGSDALYNALHALSRRAQALPIGRGMMTLCTQDFRVRDSVPIPVLNLDGRTGDGVALKNNAEEVQPDRLVWPLFHNGCAAGLRFLPLGHPSSSAEGASGQEYKNVITRHWIVHQTQSRSAQCPAARAGLLLAAGILGHLKVLQLTDIYALLVSPQPQYAWREATTIAVILGLACSFRGTNNELVFNCLSMHIQSLTPSVEDIEVSLDVQAAALVSIGLLCQRTLTNSFLVEMLLIEMSRLPSDEHCSHREGYVLAAGFGLGLLLLGIGNSHGSTARVEDRLLSFMDGARRQPVPSARVGLEVFQERHGNDAGHFFTKALLNQGVQESSECSCTKVDEGQYYNVHVSGPAAVVALGFMYLKTDSVPVAKRLLPPDRYAGLQELSPLMCLLRSMMAGLVCWSAVLPSRNWLYEHVPSTVLANLVAGGGAKLGLAQQQVHYILMNLGHCIAGSVMALGLRYAGSMDADARGVILAELQGFMKGHIGTTGKAIPVIQKSTGAYELCLTTCAIALCLVMSGTGDLKIFSLLQRLHKRTTGVPYGSHQAISMAIGLLFLGGGRLTLSNTTESIAALVLSVYPVWPTHPEDNTHHIQALRHVFGLAVVPRVLETVDALTTRPVSLPVRIILRKGRVCHEAGVMGAKNPAWTPVPRGKEGQEVRLHTPCLYPPPEMIERIEVRSGQHYPLTLYQSSGFISNNGIRLRVLEHHRDEEMSDGKEGESGTRTLSRPACELYVLDWLRALFHCPTTSMIEAFTIVDHLKLLLAALRVCSTLSPASPSAEATSSPIAAEPCGTSGGENSGDRTNQEMLLSMDFGKSVQDTLARRYCYLFSHRPLRDTTKQTQEEASALPHPLYQIFVQGKTLQDVVAGIVHDPVGSPTFPCNFSTFVVSPFSVETLRLGSTAVERSALSTGGEDGVSRLDSKAIRKLLAESMHFYGLDSPSLGDLRQILEAGKAAGDKPSASRMLTLLRVQQRTGLALDVLQNTLTCCELA